MERRNRAHVLEDVVKTPALPKFHKILIKTPTGLVPCLRGAWQAETKRYVGLQRARNTPTPYGRREQGKQALPDSRVVGPPGCGTRGGGREAEPPGQHTDPKHGLGSGWSLDVWPRPDRRAAENRRLCDDCCSVSGLSVWGNECERDSRCARHRSKQIYRPKWKKQDANLLENNTG